jgi:hypothetical protein
MKKTALFLSALAASTLLAGPYSDVISELKTDEPEFLLHMNLDGDTDTLGAFLTGLYTSYVQMNPDVPPIPVDFARVFGHLGFQNVTGYTVASEADPDHAGFINHSVFSFDGSPSGLFTLFGESNRPLTLASRTPADADLAFEMALNGDALFQIVRALVIDIMGPMGQGLIDQQLNQPVFPEGPTLAQLIEKLSTRMEFTLKAGDEPLPGPLAQLQFLTGNVALRIADVSELIAPLEPMLMQAGFAPVEGSADKTWRMDIPLGPEMMPLYLTTESATNDLVVMVNDSTSQWLASGSANSLANDPALSSRLAQLPPDGIAFWYSSKRLSQMQIDQIDAQLPSNMVQVAPLFNTMKGFLSRYAGEQIGISYLEENAYRGKAYSPTSVKTSLALALTITPASMAASLAPLIQEQLGIVPANSGTGDEAIQSNLKLIADEAMVYLVETGATGVPFQRLAEVSEAVAAIESVAGESYDEIVVMLDTSTLTVALPDGRMVSYSF